MRYAVWDDGSLFHARNLSNVRKVKDLMIPADARIVDAESGQQAVDIFRAEEASTAGQSPGRPVENEGEYEEATRPERGNNMKRKTELEVADRVDRDLDFVEGFIRLLGTISGHGLLDELADETISSMASEAHEKIISVKKALATNPSLIAA